MTYKKYIKSFTLLSTFLIFSGCTSIKNDVNVKTDTAMISVDESTHTIKTGYEETKHTVKKQYTQISNSISSLTNNFYENGIVQLFVSDETILEKRKDLIEWKKGSWTNPYKIIRAHLKSKKSNIDPQGLDLTQKIEILNKHFFKEEQKKFTRNFSKKNQKPKFDEFKTDRENIEAINNYKFQLILAKNQWEIDIKETQKKVAQKTLASLYGNPKIKNITYNPNSQELFFEIVSSRDKFSQRVSFEVEPKIGKKIKKYNFYLKPVIYYALNDNRLTLIGASVKYKEKNYLAKFTDELYQRENNIKLTTNGLDLSSMDLDYKIVSKNVNPPKWFYNLSNNNKTIGYGIGDSEQEAKNAALREIVQQLGVNVSSQIKTDKRSDGNNFSSRTQQNVNIKTKNIKLTGTKTIKSQKKNGIWFIAVSK